LSHASDTFYFPYRQHPGMINVDGDKIVLCEKKDDKTLANFIFQYKYAGLYLDRREAIDFCAEHQDDTAALGLLKLAMRDRYYGLRNYAMESLDMEKPAVKDAVKPILEDLARNDPNRTVQARAIGLLGEYKDPGYKSLFTEKSADSSYSVAGNALRGLAALDEDAAYELANRYAKQPAKGELLSAMADIFVKAGDTSKYDLVIEDLPHFALSLLKIQNDEQFSRGVDAIIGFEDAVPSGQRKQISTLINQNILAPIASRKEAMGLKAQADYVRKKIAEKKEE
jgi:aminopeptidase N